MDRAFERLLLQSHSPCILTTECRNNVLHSHTCRLSCSLRNYCRFLNFKFASMCYSEIVLIVLLSQWLFVPSVSGTATIFGSANTF